MKSLKEINEIIKEIYETLKEINEIIKGTYGIFEDVDEILEDAYDSPGKSLRNSMKSLRKP